MNQKKIYIHIGQHKTGTTSIQHALYNNQSILKKYGISLFSQNKKGKIIKTGNTSPIKKSWIDVTCNDFINYGGKLSNVELFAYSLGKCEGDVVVSTEHFSWIFNIDEIKLLRKELKKYFDQIKIIIYIRRQDKQVISHYQQASKSYKSASTIFFGNSPQAIPKLKEHHFNYLDYNKRLGLWADIFGESNLIIKIFELDLLYKQDAVADFFDILGIENFDVGVRKNISLGFAQTKVAHLMSDLKIDKNIKKNIINNLSNKNKLLPSKNEALDYYNYFKESNQSLNKRFKISEKEFIFDENFSMYPNEKTDLWTEETANDAIISILKTIDDKMYLKNDSLIKKILKKIKK